MKQTRNDLTNFSIMCRWCEDFPGWVFRKDFDHNTWLSKYCNLGVESVALLVICCIVSLLQYCGIFPYSVVWHSPAIRDFVDSAWLWSSVVVQRATLLHFQFAGGARTAFASLVASRFRPHLSELSVSPLWSVQAYLKKGLLWKSDDRRRKKLIMPASASMWSERRKHAVQRPNTDYQSAVPVVP